MASRKWLVSLLAVAFFAATRLVGLTRLPIFADEAIYLRWALLAGSEPAKYLFLPMLDGKPPLHTWLLIPWVYVFNDPLLAGRLLSVVVAVATLVVMDRLIQFFSSRFSDRVIGYLLMTFAPFWYFHQRLALAEPLLALWLAMAILYGCLFLRYKRWYYVLLFGFSFGLSLATKPNAFFFIPVLALLPWLTIRTVSQKLNLIERWKSVYVTPQVLTMALAGIGGLTFFWLLSISPLFPQLFRRSLDYTFSLGELAQGEWRYVIFQSVPRILKWAVLYFTPFLVGTWLFPKRWGKAVALMAFIYVLPLVIIGRVLYSRHLLPVAVLLTLLSVANLGEWWLKKSGRMVFIGLIALFIGWGVVFMVVAVANPDRLFIPREDWSHYLTEWSSGHGIASVRDFVRERSQYTP
ncbi:hypothetical protein A2783_04010, partial [Microgenomates group bacterium RIFCSPHIGHO2_01_FULL_45_11]